jgi:glycerophosphoryl diester phosphodiesterase
MNNGKRDAETRRHGDAATEKRRVLPPRRVSASPPPRVPLVVGHRGASAIAPENTLAAFRRAFADGADGLEFDVRLARDGVPVVIHDATLRRTALRAGAVASLASDELSETDVGSWFNLKHTKLARAEYAHERVPTLVDVFNLAGERESVLYVEMKFEAGEEFAPLAAEVVKLVREYSLLSRVVVESFTLEAVKEVKRLAPEVRTAALFDRKLSRPILPTRTLVARAHACGADEVALHYSLARRRTVEAARVAGFDALVWTVDRPVWARRAFDLGLRALITNHPARMRAALDEIIA